MSAPLTAMDRVPEGLIGRLGAWGFVTLLLGTLAAAQVARPLAVGVALGGTLTLAMLGLHRALAPTLLSAPARRGPRVLFWLIWAVKWPLICALLYLVLKHEVASPVGIALGVGILPVVATAIALRALVADLWHGARSR